MDKPQILSYSIPELQTLLSSLGQPAFRAGQIFAWLHKGTPFCEMSNLPKSLRETLQAQTSLFYPTIEKKLVSKIDGTIKYLFRLEDGQCVESVVMQYEHGNTVCISSQVGCRMGCRFCASTLGGLVRNLTPAELLGQVICAQKDSALPISNIVMMGIGEPLDNYDHVLKFLQLVHQPGGLNIGHRHISLSTCGVVDKILRLAQENLQITLSISLHACEDEKRSSIMPINRKWNLDALLSACRTYFEKTGRRISFEYTLIAKENDSIAHAEQLVKRFREAFGRSMPLHVNLIPLNPVAERPFSQSDRASVTAFAKYLTEHHISATVRRTLGPDIQASCGQLRHLAEQSDD